MLRSLSHDFSRQLKPSNGYAIFISGGKRKDPGNEGLWYNSLVLSPLQHELNMFYWCGHWGKDGGWVGKIYKHNDKSTYAEKERKNPHAGKDEKEKYCFPAKSLVHKQLGESIIHASSKYLTPPHLVAFLAICPQWFLQFQISAKSYHVKESGSVKLSSTVLMVFVVFQIMDCNYFSVALDDPFRPGVPLQWCLDLMCEKLQGVSFDGLPLWCFDSDSKTAFVGHFLSERAAEMFSAGLIADVILDHISYSRYTNW